MMVDKIIFAGELFHTFCAECESKEGGIDCLNCDLKYHFDNLAPALHVRNVDHAELVPTTYWTEYEGYGDGFMCRKCLHVIRLKDKTDLHYCPRCGASFSEWDHGMDTVREDALKGLYPKRASINVSKAMAEHYSEDMMKKMVKEHFARMVLDDIMEHLRVDKTYVSNIQYYQFTGRIVEDPEDS